MLKQLLKTSLVMSGALLLAGCNIDDEYYSDAPYQNNVYHSTTVVVRDRSHHRHPRYSAPASATGYQVSGGHEQPASTGFQAPDNAPASSGYQVSGSNGSEASSTGYQVSDGASSGPEAG